MPEPLGFAGRLSGSDPFRSAKAKARVRARLTERRALVHLAQRESLSTVFTIDRDDFETYRFGGRKRLRLLPSK